jgi:hypothetical protein
MRRHEPERYYERQEKSFHAVPLWGQKRRSAR